MRAADQVSVEAKLQQAFALHQRGQLAEARALYIEILERQPGHFDALHLLGVMALQSRRPEDAVQLIGRAIALDGGSAAAYFNRASAYRELRQFDEALIDYDRATALQPHYAEAHFGRGVVFDALGRPVDALASFDWAIRCDPNYADAFAQRGVLLHRLGHLQAALANLDRALQLKPSHVDVSRSRGFVLMEDHRYDAALASFDQALAVDPSCAEAYSGRGLVQVRLKAVSAALRDFDRAIALQPGLVEAHWNKAFALLLSGDFSDGWQEFEWRLRKKKRQELQALDEARGITQPQWRGTEPIAGKTLLLYGEQGLGDRLQFCRYVAGVAALGANVILEAPPALVSLFRSLRGVTRVVTLGDPLPPADYCCPMMSLPLAFKTTLSTIPVQIPYLESPSDKRVLWRARLGPTIRPRVGLAWSGGLQAEHRDLWSAKSLPLRHFEKFGSSSVEFYSLQKGQPAESELAEVLASKWSGPDLIDHMGDIRDLGDTAALIENLDLVISVDTSIAHLAGALGKPVWLLNPFGGCWRWLLDRTDSPWYPTMRIYRQHAPNDWSEVLRRITKDLNDLWPPPHSGSL